jgi:Ni/Fe-hydrogenase 1 B-type cytochrome subunit
LSHEDTAGIPSIHLAAASQRRIESPQQQQAASWPHEYRVWDLTVRLCHWTIVASFLFLTVTGVIILYSAELEIAGAAKVGLKHVHVWGGYVCAAAVLVRIIHGFVGSQSSRWARILPLSKGYPAELAAYLAAKRADRRPYAGHNPAGRLMVTTMIVLLVVQVVTGLLIGSTDTYAWPFGDAIREWVAAPGVDPATLVAGTKTGVSETAWAEMRAFRYPFYITHEYVFYALALLVVIHIIGVVRGETTGRTPLVSAMITGRKRLPGPAVDM